MQMNALQRRPLLVRISFTDGFTAFSMLIASEISANSHFTKSLLESPPAWSVYSCVILALTLNMMRLWLTFYQKPLRLICSPVGDEPAGRFGAQVDEEKLISRTYDLKKTWDSP
jgi:hypothetical protein